MINYLANLTTKVYAINSFQYVKIILNEDDIAIN